MKPILLFILSVFASSVITAQNTDLPSPTANNQTLPTGSYVIAMDNTNQLNAAGYFNLKTYGLIVTLLNNSKKLKWVIKAGKAKDANDFTVNASALIPVAAAPVVKKITVSNGSTAATLNNAVGISVGMYVSSGSAGIQAGTTITAISGTNITLSLPATAAISNKDANFVAYSYPVSSYNFKAGPFVIFAADTTGVGALINTFNNSLSGNDKIKVYKTAASVTVDVRYDMTGFVPKGAILDDGGNVNIHTTYMSACNIPSSNYFVTIGQNLLTDCYTFASEPHNGNTGSNIDDAIVAIKRFVEYGGNFLAQCYAIINYENNALGRFQTTTGITDVGSGAGTSITYPNADLSYTQYEGNFSISQGGSLQNWRINAAGANNFHKHSRGISDTTVTGCSVSKLKTGSGGLVFYLGNHNYNNYSNPLEINGLRMYMNAFLTPVTVANNCTIGDSYMSPLSAKLISFQGSESNGAARLNWEINQNENVNHFEIERSTDGYAYTSAALIQGNNLTGSITYQQIDIMPANRVYYRLKITDKDGTARYSKVILLQMKTDDSQGIRITSNPVIDRLGLEYRTSRHGPAEIRIMDMLGRVQLKQTIISYEGTNALNLTLPYAWQQGVYVIEITSGQERYTAKFIKQQ